MPSRMAPMHTALSHERREPGCVRPSTGAEVESFLILLAGSLVSTPSRTVLGVGLDRGISPTSFCDEACRGGYPSVVTTKVGGG